MGQPQPGGAKGGPARQVRIEEEQRVLGIFPNFYVVYDHDAAPLTTKLKFQLAFKTSTDPVTVIGVGVLAGINQAGLKSRESRWMKRAWALADKWSTN